VSENLTDGGTATDDTKVVSPMPGVEETKDLEENTKDETVENTKEPEKDTEEGGEAVDPVEHISYMPKGSEIYVKQPVQVRALKMDRKFSVNTNFGEVVGQAGDYLLESQVGELYPCNVVDFAKNYKKA